jgi:hypothetical protein
VANLPKEIEMTEPTQKTKAPAKPRSAATKSKKTTAPAEPEKVATITPTREQIAALAHKYWAERGHRHGHAEQDWLRAEQELSIAS